MANEDRLILPTDAMKAWGDTFEKGIYLDHKPSPEELIMLRMKAICVAQDAKTASIVAKELFDELDKILEPVDFHKGVVFTYDVSASALEELKTRFLKE